MIVSENIQMLYVTVPRLEGRSLDMMIMMPFLVSILFFFTTLLDIHLHRVANLSDLAVGNKVYLILARQYCLFPNLFKPQTPVITKPSYAVKNDA